MFGSGKGAAKVHRKLRDEAVSKSASPDWHHARREWAVVGCREAPPGGALCPCGRTFGGYAYRLHNPSTGKTLEDVEERCASTFRQRRIDEGIAMQRRVMALLDAAAAEGRTGTVRFDRKLFTTKMIEYMYARGVFKPTPYNRGEPAADARFMADMLFERNRTEKQQAKVDAIMRSEIYPWLRDEWARTHPPRPKEEKPARRKNYSEGSGLQRNSRRRQ